MKQNSNGSATDIYSTGYLEWKAWTRLFSHTQSESRYYSNEFSEFELSGRSVLEIGFGNGSFLSWARSEGAKVVGCELIEHICRAGSDIGYDVRFGNVCDMVHPKVEKFDLIVAFDVLEHIPQNELLDFFRFIQTAMNPEAHLFVRVPNGQSPFGLANQNGDITHVNALSKGKFEQIASILGLDLMFCRNEFRTGKSSMRVFDTVRFMVRDLTSAFIRSIYGIDKIPLDPNIVACFKNSQ